VTTREMQARERISALREYGLAMLRRGQVAQAEEIKLLVEALDAVLEVAKEPPDPRHWPDWDPTRR
jgi:hypothetical protein